MFWQSFALAFIYCKNKNRLSKYFFMYVPEQIKQQYIRHFLQVAFPFVNPVCICQLIIFFIYKNSNSNSNRAVSS